jgi:uncharacterized integral membrane protein
MDRRAAPGKARKEEYPHVHGKKAPFPARPSARCGGCQRKSCHGGFFFAMRSGIMLLMRAFVWFIRIVLFFLLLSFAVKNDHVADLNFFFGRQWHLPLVFIILIAFGVGALLGVTATVTSLLRQRREISRLRRQLERAGKAALPDETARLSGPF